MSDYTPLEQWLYDTGIAMPGQVKSMASRIEHSEWLAAHDAEKRAEWEAEQGEPEWEYGYDSVADAEAERPSMRRRKAGPWLPVPDTTGAET